MAPIALPSTTGRHVSATVLQDIGIALAVLLSMLGVSVGIFPFKKDLSAPDSADLVGCYAYSTKLEDSSKYLKFTDPFMTYSKCQNLLETQNVIPPYTMFSKRSTTGYRNPKLFQL